VGCFQPLVPSPDHGPFGRRGSPGELLRKQPASFVSGHGRVQGPVTGPSARTVQTPRRTSERSERGPERFVENLSAFIFTNKQLVDCNDGLPGSSYEPPLTNVFTMQWFLTLFATCLPSETVLRVWDSIMLDGNEFLLRVALSVWVKLEK